MLFRSKVYDLLPYISSIYTPSNYAALRKDGVSTGYESTTHFMRPRPKYTIEIACDMRLFLAHEHVDGSAGELPVLAYLVLEVAAVGFLYPLREVAEEDECRHLRAFEHGDIFDFHKLALVAWRGICGDVLLHYGVELRCGHGAAAVLVDFERGFEHLVDSLFGERRSEHDGEVGEGCETFPDGFLEALYGFLGLVFHEVPLVHHHHQSLAVALDERENVYVLRLDASDRKSVV